MTDKEPTARQRSAFSDAVEILNELTDLSIPPEKMIKAMEHSVEEYGKATGYMFSVCASKMGEEKGIQNDID